MITVNLLPEKEKIKKACGKLPETKLCSKCNIVKASSEFYTRTSKINGVLYTYLGSYCKTCKNIEESKRLNLFFQRPESVREEERKHIKNFNKNITEKLCRRCNVVKDIKLFGEDIRYRDGMFPWCNECRGVVPKKQRIENRAHVLKRDKKYRDSCTHYYMWAQGTFKNHKHNGYKLKVGTKYLEELAKNIENCVFCGSALLWKKNNKVKQPNSPSLENLNCEKILHKDNITIICCKCNTVKSNNTLAEFFDYCELIYKNKNKILKRIKNKTEITKNREA